MGLFRKPTPPPATSSGSSDNSRGTLPDPSTRPSSSEQAAFGVLHASGLSVVVDGPGDASQLAAAVNTAAPKLRGSAVNESVVEISYPGLELWTFLHQSEQGAAFSVVLVGPRSGPDTG